MEGMETQKKRSEISYFWIFMSDLVFFWNFLISFLLCPMIDCRKIRVPIGEMDCDVTINGIASCSNWFSSSSSHSSLTTLRFSRNVLDVDKVLSYTIRRGAMLPR